MKPILPIVPPKKPKTLAAHLVGSTFTFECRFDPRGHDDIFYGFDITISPTEGDRDGVPIYAVAVVVTQGVETSYRLHSQTTCPPTNASALLQLAKEIIMTVGDIRGEAALRAYGEALPDRAGPSRASRYAPASRTIGPDGGE